MFIPTGQFFQLKRFLREIRNIPVKNDMEFNAGVSLLLAGHRKDESFKRELTELVLLLMNKASFVSAFTDYGINSNRGFFQEIYSRIKHKILPPKLEENELSNFINFLFPEKKDLIRLSKISTENWQLLLELLQKDLLAAYEKQFLLQLYNAIIILSHRLTSIGIDPYVVKRLPKADDNDSPFFELNELVVKLAKNHLQTNTYVSADEIEAARKKLQQCETLLKELENQKDETGISLHLTFLIRLAFQQTERIRILVKLFLSTEYTQKVTVISKLIVELAIAEKERTSIRKFFNENTQLLAYRVISHTSEKGEHYIGFSKKENKKLFRSALGGGFVVVFLVYIKHFIHQLHLAPFGEGLLFGINYAVGFVFMHLVHFTLATKQPAMTASYMAASLEGDINISKAARAFRQVMRSQFISLVGNLLVVLPLCFISAYMLATYCDMSVFTTKEAMHQFDSNHPWLSASLFYAFVTGIFLSLSGYITGYVDNKMVFSEIPYRIRNHPALLRKFKGERLQKWADFIETNAGAIIGNIFLGLSLGMAGNIGKFLGLPFDIRHITISAGNFGIGLGSTHFVSISFLITVFAGVLLIGIINIISSFLISFALACRSRNLSLKQSLGLLVGIGK